MRLSPVFGERALYTDAGGEPTLVVGDLHVGLEGDLHRSGVHIPSQTGEMRDRLEALVDGEGARRLVVLGDLKETVSHTSRREARDLAELFEGLDVDLHLVPGNHDAGIAEHVPDAAVHPSDGMTLGDEVGLAHGHTWPSEAVMSCPRVVFSHSHPTILLEDELGGRHKEPCWLRAAFTEAARERYPDLPAEARLVLVPAFNTLLGGSPLNDPAGDPGLGPVLENGLVDVDGARVWTLDGLELGTLESLRAYGGPAPREAREEEADG